MDNNDKNNRILMIAPTPFFADRGCHVRIQGEAKALIALGNQLVLCTYHLGKDIDGIPTERTLTIPWYKKLSAGPSFHKFYIDLLLLWKVIAVCRKFQPDIIHAHLHEGIIIGKIVSKLFGIPMVADLQGSLTGELLDHGFIPRVRWFMKLMNLIEKKINLMPRYLITSSSQTSRTCTNKFRIHPDQIITVMDGTDLEAFSLRKDGLELRESLSILSDEKVVVFTGALTDYQGIDILLEAIPLVVKNFPKVKFLIVGYPNEQLYRQKAWTATRTSAPILMKA